MPTVAQLKASVRAHNKKHCIKLSQRKAQLISALAKSTGNGGGAGAGGSGASGASSAGAGAGMKKKKKRIKPVLVSPLASVGAGALPSASGGTVGQKKFAKKISKMNQAYQKLGGKDANKDLAF
jgi:hypothetical protein